MSTHEWPGDDLDQLNSVLEVIEYVAHNDVKADGMQTIWEFARYAQMMVPRIRNALDADKLTAASVSEPRLGMSMPGKDASRTVPQASQADNREAVTGPHGESCETNWGATGGRQLQPALRTGVASGAVDTLSPADPSRAANSSPAALDAAGNENFKRIQVIGSIE
jgi:hypothetical protein